jgi:hypothetical protein
MSGTCNNQGINEKPSPLKRVKENITVRSGKVGNLILCFYFISISFVMSVRLSAWNNSAPTGRISMKFDIWGFFENLLRKIQVLLESDKDKGYFTWRPIHILIISRSYSLTTINVSDKRCRENQNAHFVFSNFFSLKSYHQWDNVEKYCRAGQATDDNMAHVHCMLDS